MIKLRPASFDDLPVLEHWGGQAHVREAGVVDWDFEADLQWDSAFVENLIAELDGRPISFVQIIDPAREESHYWGEIAENLRAVDIFIGEAEDLNRGYGSRIMSLALKRCFADETVTGILIDPLATNTAAHRFYERQGFAFQEERRFGDDLCKVYRLPRQSRLSLS